MIVPSPNALSHSLPPTPGYDSKGVDPCFVNHGGFGLVSPPTDLREVFVLKERKVMSHSRVQLFATPRTVAYQAPLSMGFSRQEYWSGLPFPSPGDLPDPGLEPRSPTLRADALPSEPPGKPPFVLACFNSTDLSNWSVFGGSDTVSV